MASIALLGLTAACQGRPLASSVSPRPTAGGAASNAPSVAPATLHVGVAPYRLAAPVERSVTGAIAGSVYIAGGLDASGTTASGVYCMNPRSGHLTSAGDLPQPVHDAAAAVIGGTLVVFGGGSSAGTDLVQTFDPRTGSAAITGHLPVALSDLSAGTVGTTTYLVGGYDGSQPRREIYATTDGRTFTTVARLPVGLRYPAVTAVGTALVIAGGETATGETDAVYVLDTTSGSVRAVAHLAAPLGHAAAFTLGDLAYVVGGRAAAGNATSSAVSIDPATGVVTNVAALPLPVADAAVASRSDSVLLIGGWAGSTLDRIEVASLRPTTGGATSDPASPVPDAASVRPFAGRLLIADRGNNRLLVMNAQKHIIWQYPSPSLPPPSTRFYFPDDAFWVHGGRAILVNEEENNLMAEIGYPSGRTLWTYGHAGVAGSGPGYLHQPDDVFPYPGGGVAVADAKNCRILVLGPSGHPVRQIGTTGVCAHGLPGTVGYPNGDTPLPNGHLLLSELDGGWVDEVTGTGQVIWSRQVPGVPVPSDPQRLADGSYLVADYQSPGAVVRFDGSGKVLWTYRVATGPGALDHPSLAVPLPNGLVGVNDDYHHRVVFIDPATNRIVWQYGTGVSGSGSGQLSFPDGFDLLLPGNGIPLHVDFVSTAVAAGRP